MAEVTPTQGRYLSYIRAYRNGFGSSPSESEIAKALDVSSPSVNQMMKTLERKGLIRRQPGVPRSIEILVADDAIPKWKGKRITRTVWGWAPAAPPAAPPARRRGRARDEKAAVYCFKIILQDTDPMIWRRIETKDVTLEKLHALIQTAMGWTNSHPHQFMIAGALYADPRFMMGGLGALDYSGIRIGDLVSKHGSKLRMGYEYDFGDSWQHEVVLEKVTESEPGAKYPRCLEGARACPPENVGGVDGFADYVEAVTNPNHSEHGELLEWNGPFDPAQFDSAKATQRMRKGLPTW